MPFGTALLTLPLLVKASGFPIKDFGNDEGGGFPERLYHPVIRHS